jgi:hypothetical protein
LGPQITYSEGVLITQRFERKKRTTVYSNGKRTDFLQRMAKHREDRERDMQAKSELQKKK